MIYHYCTDDVFIKIIESKHIWLSDVTKMNDIREYKSGFSVIEEILKDYPSIDQEAVTEMSPNNINETFKILIACFSKNGDIRSQWVSYANDGAGLSIGFNQEFIKQNNQFNRYLEHLAPISNSINFLDVIYDEELLKIYAKTLIDRWINSQSPIKFKLLSRELMYLAIKYKDKFFKEEKEVRGFISVENNIKGDNFDINQRNGIYGPTSYHSLNTSFERIHSIKEVIIGPKNNSSIEEIKNCLSNYGLDSVHVRHSDGRGKYR